eukprot:767645-Hanusia_phi.AAC.5
MDDIAEALRQAEIEEGGKETADPDQSTKAAIDELMEEVEVEEDEEDEEEGSDGSPVTGWEEDEDEYGPDEGQGLSWVQQAREMAEQEAAEMSLRVVDARWTRGKLVFKVEHLNADLFAVGIEECERMSKSLGNPTRGFWGAW